MSSLAVTDLTDAFHENVQSVLRQELPDHGKRSNPVGIRPPLPRKGSKRCRRPGKAEDPKKAKAVTKAKAGGTAPAASPFGPQFVFTNILIIVSGMATHSLAKYWIFEQNKKTGESLVVLFGIYCAVSLGYTLLYTHK